MNVGIIGMGFVGLSLGVVLASKNISVFGIESDCKKLEHLQNGTPPFYEPDLESLLLESYTKKKIKFLDSLDSIFEKLDVVFVTVGTPTKNDHIDLTAIKAVIQSIGKLLKKSKNCPLIVIKSTIAPGTTKDIIIPILEKNSSKKLGKNLRIATNPEFLREGQAIFDQLNPHVIVIGSEDDDSRRILTNFYKDFFPSKIPRIHENFSTSEMIKYTNNAFLATKISFINTISNICQKIPNTNVDSVAKCIGLDPRIGSEFLKAGPGYGGSCLPKDLDSFISIYKKYDVDPVLFSGVKKINQNQINEIIKIMKKNLKTLNKKYISIFGLSFKENSDDIRESTSIHLIQKLLKEKCKINVHDPLAIPNTKKIFKNKISYFNDIRKCLKSSECLIIMTAWPQYGKITSTDITKMKKSFIIDTRRILLPKICENYNALGIGNQN